MRDKEKCESTRVSLSFIEFSDMWGDGDMRWWYAMVIMSLWLLLLKDDDEDSYDSIKGLIRTSGKWI